MCIPNRKCVDQPDSRRYKAVPAAQRILFINIIRQMYTNSTTTDVAGYETTSKKTRQRHHHQRTTTTTSFGTRESRHIQLFRPSSATYVGSLRAFLMLRALRRRIRLLRRPRAIVRDLGQALLRRLMAVRPGRAGNGATFLATVRRRYVLEEVRRNETADAVRFAVEESVVVHLAVDPQHVARSERHLHLVTIDETIRDGRPSLLVTYFTCDNGEESFNVSYWLQIRIRRILDEDGATCLLLLM